MQSARFFFLGFLILFVFHSQGDIYAQHNPVDSLENAYKIYHNPEILFFLGMAYSQRDVDKTVATHQRLIETAKENKDTLLLAEAYLMAGKIEAVGKDQKTIALDYFHRGLQVLQNQHSARAEACRLWLGAVLKRWNTPFVIMHNSTLFYDSTIVINLLKSISLQSNNFLLAEAWGELQSYRGSFHKFIFPCAQEKDSDYTLPNEHYYQLANCFDGITVVQFQRALGYYYECLLKYPNMNPIHCQQCDSLFHDVYRRAALSENTLVCARTLNYFAYKQIEKHQYDSALYLVNEAIALAKKMKDVNQLARYYQTFRDIYIDKNDYKKALFYTDFLNDFKDSLVMLNNMEELGKIQNNYENQKRDIEISGLRVENDKRQSEIRQTKIIYGVVIGILILATSSLIIFLRQRQKITTQLKKNEELNALLQQNMESQLSTVKMQALNAQMNPHFIFNALGSIQSLIMEEDKTQAIRYLHDFASLSRLTMEYSRKEKIKLKDEIAYLKSYLQLEALRHQESFAYAITVSPEVDMDYETRP